MYILRSVREGEVVFRGSSLIAWVPEQIDQPKDQRQKSVKEEERGEGGRRREGRLAKRPGGAE